MMDQAWQSSPFFVEPLQPPPLQAKAGWKTLEAELQYQSQYCHDKIQRDMGNLHAQVLNEIHAAVAQELQRMQHNMTALHGTQTEAHRDREQMWGAIGQVHVEFQQIRKENEDRSKELSDVLAEAVARMAKNCNESLQKETEARSKSNDELSLGLADLHQSLMRRLEDLTVTQKAALQEAAKAMDAKWQQLEDRVAKQEALSEENRALAEKTLAALPNLQAMNLNQLGDFELQLRSLQEGLAQREEGSKCDLEALEKKLQQNFQEALQGAAKVAEDFRAEQEQMRQKALERDEALEKMTKDSASDLRGFAARLDATESLLAGARSSEQRLQDQLMGLEQSLEERQRSSARDLERLKSDCHKEFAFAQSTWARTIDWQAQVDLTALGANGKLDVSSPKFMAATLEGLQLHLRIQAWKDRYASGVFLQAPNGQVSFKLSLGTKSSSFHADFASAPEWGSQRLAVFDQLDPVMNVRLEIQDVSVPLSKGYPLALSVSAKSTDAAEAASREAAAVRSTMVKRIEWRVGRISEHVAAVRAAANAGGEEEAWQPIVSPPFAAGGFENLQLHLYPLGYRVKGEDSCGFFLVCPRGMHVKCKAFVGDMVRVWDHHYEEREPYGRGNFCRLLDKVENDDSILCGIELQEIRMEQTTQVRGGPFGSVVDEVKLVVQPSTGGMEMVRELRDHSLKVKRKVQSRAALHQYAHLAPSVDERLGAPDRIPVPLPGLAVSKSSPQLPSVGSPTKFELPISPKISKWR